MFFRSKRSRQARAVARAYDAVVAQARHPTFYTELDAPDTVDGRFELIALHLFLVLHRLKGDGAEAEGFNQALFDRMFQDMDYSLREMGVGDLGVPKRIKKMATRFYGRVVAYERGLAADDARLMDALDRNLYATVTPRAGTLPAMAGYMRREAGRLAGAATEDLMTGALVFGAPPLREAA